ncbi:MAG: hypothetical protein AB1746_08020 [Candidatus Zixiibacteriota bacterium]
MKKYLFIILFAVAMAYFEAAVVVYLRQLYYPGGFSLPLVSIPERFIVIEIIREASTIVMLLMAAALAGRKLWERFGYFLILFGIWDIFYYVWLKVTINWPASLYDWDVLFLIPVPWIGPVIAPVAISIVMIITGYAITRLFNKGRNFRPTFFSWIIAIIATMMILFSFMYDFGATLHYDLPRPYMYWLLISGLTLYIWAYLHSYSRTKIFAEP